MISDRMRELILEKKQYNSYLSLRGQNLTDEDLISIAELVTKNPGINCISLEYNPDITALGVNRLREKLPNVAIINCDCFLSIEEEMERSSDTLAPRGRLTFIKQFDHAYKANTTCLDNDKYSISDLQTDSTFKY